MDHIKPQTLIFSPISDTNVNTLEDLYVEEKAKKKKKKHLQYKHQELGKTSE